MTIKELIKILKRFPNSAQVVIGARDSFQLIDKVSVMADHNNNWTIVFTPAEVIEVKQN